MKKLTVVIIILIAIAYLLVHSPMGANERGIEDLELYLNQFQWDRPYEMDKFDCSDMSVALEKKLERRGYHTKIAVTKEHMWLMVEITPDEYTPVEATSLTIIKPENKNYREYFNYVGLLEESWGGD